MEHVIGLWMLKKQEKGQGVLLWYSLPAM